LKRFVVMLAACALLFSGCGGKRPQEPLPGGGGAPPPVAGKVDPGELALPFPAGEVQNT